MTKPKFKIGDRVRRINHSTTFASIGELGTVMDVSSVPEVRYDNGNSARINSQDNLELIQPAMTQPTLEQVRDAAKTSPEARKALEKLFPEIMEPEPFEFGASHSINTYMISPVLYIGTSDTPPGLSDKCIIVHPDYRMEASEHRGRTILTFYKK